LLHLRRLLNDVNEQVRVAVVPALANLGPDAVFILRSALRHPDRHVRRNVVWALQKIGPTAIHALPDLCDALLEDDDQRTRTGIAQCLGNLGPAAEAAIPALIAVLGDGNRILNRLSAKALSQIGPVALPALLDVLVGDNDYARAEAAIALGWMGPAAREAVYALAAVLENESGAVPIGWVPPEMVRDDDTPSPRNSKCITPPILVVPYGPDGDDTARLRSAQALGHIGASARSAVSALTQAAVHDPSERVRVAAAAALTRIRQLRR
jgi:HEAT repeat protein